MIQLRTMLNVADNSGARKLQCFHVMGGSYRRYAILGDIIVCSVMDALPNGAIKKGDGGQGRRRARASATCAAPTAPTSASTTTPPA